MPAHQLPRFAAPPSWRGIDAAWRAFRWRAFRRRAAILGIRLAAGGGGTGGGTFVRTLGLALADGVVTGPEAGELNRAADALIASMLDLVAAVEAARIKPVVVRR